MGDKEIDYAELDRKISEIFDLSKGCVFVLSIHDDYGVLEFVYPPQFKGNVFPVDNKSIAGRAVIAKRSYISNNVPGEKAFVILDWLMRGGGVPIQKVITYPVVFADNVIAVLQITRKGQSLSEAGPNFQNEDLEKIKSALYDFLSLHTVKSASRE